jgi:hypothetical protein
MAEQRPGLTVRCPAFRLEPSPHSPRLIDHLRIRDSHTIALLLPLLLLIGSGAVKAAEVTAESIIDQASALRDASSRVPAGARVLSSDCSDVALPGLSFRYRCSVRYDPAPPRPNTAPAPAGTR